MRDLLVRLRRTLASWVLKGRLLELWLAVKIKRLERQYLRELLAHSSRPKPALDLPKLKRGDPLRRILFISDVQWELKELAIDLENICPVTTWNLHPALIAAHPHQPPSGTVTRALRDLIETRRPLEPDLILFYASSLLLSEEVFEQLRRTWSCPLLGLNLDDKIEFLDYQLFRESRQNYQKWAAHFDLNLTNVRAIADWYSDRQLPVYYMPEGYHPKPDCPFPEARPQYKYEISFVGSWRPERDRFFRQLRRLGVPLEPVGFGWPNPEPGKDPEKVYRSSMMNLGIGFASPSEALTTLKTRDFECPGAGACYLTTYNWELALHYDLGREILCYRSMEELVELFSFYRRRPDDCWKIAQAAHRRCLNEHTWERRFRALFKELRLEPTG